MALQRKEIYVKGVKTNFFGKTVDVQVYVFIVGTSGLGITVIN